MNAERGTGSGAPAVAIVGLGLIGGSIARRLRESGWTVRWNDPAVAPGTVESAGAGLEPIAQPELKDVDLVVLATPTDVAIDLLRELDLDNAAVTSVCSVMKPLAEVAASRAIRFVAGHPMAGREVKGWDHSQSTLFESRPWFRASGSGGDAKAVDLVDHLIGTCGATVVPVDPSAHDRYAAVASHLPQLLSSAMAALIDESDIPEPFRGPGLRTFLRLAASPWSMWEPVFEMNAEAVSEAKRQLDQIVERVMSGEGREVFETANELHRDLAAGELKTEN